MGLFEKAGRRFEQIKQEATDAAKEQAEFECEACEKKLFTERDACPECGAEAVVPIKSDEEQAKDTTDQSPTTSEQSDDEPNDSGQTPTDT